MKFISFAALAVALVAGSPALAAAEKSESVDQAKAEKVEKTVCKRLATSGTRMAKRVCLTAGQWKKVEAEARS